MSNAIQSAGNDVTKTINAVGDIGQAIIDNPLPVIETVALTAVLGPGGSLGAEALTATQAAAVSGAAVTAANGGNPQQIAEAAVSAGVGSEVAQAVAPVVGPTPISGAAPGSANPLSTAAGGAAGGATKAALTGQDIAKGAVTGGAISGLASAGAQEASSLYGNLTTPKPSTVYDYSGTIGSPPIQTNVQANYGIEPQGNPYAPGRLGVNALPTTDLSSPIGQASTPSEIGLRATLANTPVFTPGGVDYSLQPTQTGGEGLSGAPQDAIQTSPQTLSPGGQAALQDVFGFGLSTLLAPKATGLGALNASTTGVGTSGGTTGTTSSTTGGAPGGTELDPSTGKAPELAWGDKYSSLKEGLNV